MPGKSQIEQVFSAMRRDVSPEDRARTAEVANPYSEVFHDVWRDLKEQHFSGFSNQSIVREGGSRCFPSLIARIKECLKGLLKEKQLEEQIHVIDVLCDPVNVLARAEYVPGRGYNTVAVRLVAALRFMFSDRARNLLGEQTKLKTQAWAIRAQVVCFITECLDLSSANQAVDMQDSLIDTLATIRRGGCLVSEQGEVDADSSESEIQNALMMCLQHKLHLQGRRVFLDEALLPLLKQAIQMGLKSILDAFTKDGFPKAVREQVKAAWAITYRAIESGGCPGVVSWDDWDKLLGADFCKGASVFLLLKRSIMQALAHTQGESSSLLEELNENLLLKRQAHSLHICVRGARNCQSRQGEDEAPFALLLDVLFDDLVLGEEKAREIFSSCNWAALEKLDYPTNPVMVPGKLRLITDARSLGIPTVSEPPEEKNDSELSEAREENLVPFHVGQERSALLEHPEEHWHVMTREKGLPTAQGDVIAMRVPAKTKLNMAACSIDPKSRAIILLASGQALPEGLDPNPGQLVLVKLDRSQCGRPPEGFDVRHSMTPTQFRERFEGRQMYLGRESTYPEYEEENMAKYLLTGLVDLTGIDVRLFSNDSYHSLLMASRCAFDRRWFGVFSCHLQKPEAGVAKAYEMDRWNVFTGRYKTLKDCQVSESLNLEGAFNPEWPIYLSMMKKRSSALDATETTADTQSQNHIQRWLDEGHTVIDLPVWRNAYSRGLRNSHIELRLSLDTRFFKKMKEQLETQHLWIKIPSFGFYFVVHAINHCIRMNVLQRLSQQKGGLSESRCLELEEIFKHFQWSPTPRVIQNYLHHQLRGLDCLSQLSAYERDIFLGGSPDDSGDYLPLFDKRTNLLHFVMQCFPGTRNENELATIKIAEELKASIPQDDSLMNQEQHQVWYEGKKDMMMTFLNNALREKAAFKSFVERLLNPENALFLGVFLMLSKKVEDFKSNFPEHVQAEMKRVKFLPEYWSLKRAYDKGHVVHARPEKPAFGGRASTHFEYLSRVLSCLPRFYSALQEIQRSIEREAERSSRRRSLLGLFGGEVLSVRSPLLASGHSRSDS